MVQMRFSKKKAAQDVLRHLEFARDQAVVVRGMGLGGVEGSGVGNGDGEGGGDGSGGNGLVVEDKKGKKRVVGDKSAMYVDEAWVGRGPYEFGSLHRARGRIDRLRLPYTSEFLPFPFPFLLPFLLIFSSFNNTPNNHIADIQQVSQSSSKKRQPAYGRPRSEKPRG